MPSSDYTISPHLTQRWLALAQRRKAHLIDLYETGRWQRYYNEPEFAQRLRAAIDAVEQWSVTAHASSAPHPAHQDHADSSDADAADTWAPPTQPSDEAADHAPGRRELARAGELLADS